MLNCDVLALTQVGAGS
jgi:hypothetical protein